MNTILSNSFFNRSALRVGEELLGKYLMVRKKDKIYAYKITETEAYVGPHDKGSHAYKGRTPRTEVMYGEAGTLYVYFVYGMYHMVNVVTGKKEYPAAVLIRGVEGISGPGKLTRDLGITKRENGVRAHPRAGNVWFEDRGVRISKKQIARTPRIGIVYAKEWKDKPYRFVLKTETSKK